MKEVIYYPEENYLTMLVRTSEEHDEEGYVNWVLNEVLIHIKKGIEEDQYTTTHVDDVSFIRTETQCNKFVLTSLYVDECLVFSIRHAPFKAYSNPDPIIGALNDIKPKLLSLI